MCADRSGPVLNLLIRASSTAHHTGASSSATVAEMKTSLSAVLTTITFVPNDAPQIPYWNGIERRNVETANERMLPMSSDATAVRVVKIPASVPASVAAPAVVSSVNTAMTGTAAPGNPSTPVIGSATLVSAVTSYV